MLYIWCEIFWDGVPILCLLIFHYQNFKPHQHELIIRIRNQSDKAQSDGHEVVNDEMQLIGDGMMGQFIASQESQIMSSGSMRSVKRNEVGNTVSKSKEGFQYNESSGAIVHGSETSLYGNLLGANLGSPRDQVVQGCSQLTLSSNEIKDRVRVNSYAGTRQISSNQLGSLSQMILIKQNTTTRSPLATSSSQAFLDKNAYRTNPNSIEEQSRASYRRVICSN